MIAADKAAAHQQQEAQSVILFNERSGNIEVMHRFYIHDAEHVAKLVGEKSSDLLASEQAQATFGNYVAKHFGLRWTKRVLPISADSDTPLSEVASDVVPELQYVGQEVEGKFLWIYQSTAIPEPLLAWLRLPGIGEGRAEEGSKGDTPVPQWQFELEVIHTSLHEYWPKQRNVVNIEFHQRVQTLVFHRDDLWQRVTLP